MAEFKPARPVRPVRGMHDLLGEEMRRFRRVAEIFRAVAGGYDYQEISTPVLEFTEVFARSLGETTDVVSKEMYSFEDRGGDSLTLRPECTAGIARAFISQGLAQQAPCKFFSMGPMFRYERPQKGRFRQFHQLDVEVLGVAGTQADIEVIALAADVLEKLGLDGPVRLEINTLGDGESRESYRNALVSYFGGHRADLSQDSLLRLERNPLRILDSKDQGDRKLFAAAPKISDHLNGESAEFFARVLEGLDLLGIDYMVNEQLVRGLDYYTHTAFEFVTDELGAQGAVIAGGRYDRLIEHLGGRPTPGIGWAAGIERLAMLLSIAPPAPRPVAVIPADDAAQAQASVLAHRLRREGFVVDTGYSGNLAKRMKRANKVNACAAVILGERELEQETATVRDMDSGEQKEIPLARVAEELAPYRRRTR